MRIEQLSLSNWLSYPARWQVNGQSIVPCLKFNDEPVYLIYGRNGAGKSSLMDAIIFALFGDYSRAAERQEIKKSDAIRTGERTASVELIFSLGDTRHRVQRMLSGGKSKAAEASYSVWDAVQGIWVQADSGVEPVNSRVESLLGMKQELFCGTVLLEQGKTTHFMNLKPSQQVQHVTELLGLRAYEDYYQKAKELANQCKRQAQGIEIDLKPLADASDEKVIAAEAEVQRWQASLAQLEIDIEQLNQLLKDSRRVQDLRQQLAQALKDMAGFETQIQQAESIRASRRIVDQWERLEPISREVKLAGTSVKTAQQHLTDLEEKFQATHKQHTATEAKLAELRPKHEQAKAKLDEVRTTLDALLLKQREAGNQLRLIQSEVTLDLKEVDLNQLQATRIVQLQALPQLQVDYELYRELLEVAPQLDAIVRDLVEAEKARQEGETTDSSLQAATSTLATRRETLAQLKKQESEAAGRFTTAREYAIQVDRDVAAKEALLGNRQRAHGQAECPVCGTPLEGAVLDRFHQELHDLERQVEQGREEVKRAKQSMGDLEQQHKRLNERATAEDRAVAKEENSLASRRADLVKQQAASTRQKNEALGRWQKLKDRSQQSRPLLLEPTQECCKSLRQHLTARQSVAHQHDQMIGVQAEFNAAVSTLKEMQLQRRYPANTFDQAQLDEATGAVTQLDRNVTRLKQEVRQHETAERQLANEIIGAERDSENTLTQAQYIEQIDLPAARPKLANDESYLADAVIRFDAVVSELDWPAEHLGWLRSIREGDVLALDSLTGWIEHHRITAGKLGALEKAERQIGELRARKAEIEKQSEEYSSEVKDAEPTTVAGRLKECRTTKVKLQEALALAHRAYGAEVTRIERKCELEQRLLKVRQDEVDYRHLENLLAPPSRNSEGGPLLQRITRGVLEEVAARSSKILEDWGQSTEVVIPVDTMAFRVIDRAAGSAERHFQLFSGGEKFLVALAIAISIGEVAGATGHPDCLFIDEGFGLLDADNRARVAQEIVSRLVASGRRKQVVVITHMEDIQSAFTARYHLVNDGTATRLQSENEDDLS